MTPSQGIDENISAIRRHDDLVCRDSLRLRHDLSRRISLPNLGPPFHARHLRQRDPRHTIGVADMEEGHLNLAPYDPRDASRELNGRLRARCMRHRDQDSLEAEAAVGWRDEAAPFLRHEQGHRFRPTRDMLPGRPLDPLQRASPPPGRKHDHVGRMLVHILEAGLDRILLLGDDLLHPHRQLIEHRGARAATLQHAPALERSPDRREACPALRPITAGVQERKAGLANQRDRQGMRESVLAPLGEVGRMEDRSDERKIVVVGHGVLLSARWNGFAASLITRRSASRQGEPGSEICAGSDLGLYRK